MKEIFLQSQRNEITEHQIYSRLASKTKDKENKEVLKRLLKTPRGKEKIIPLYGIKNKDEQGWLK